MKKIAIFGGGGFGREVQMLVEQINEVKEDWDFIGFYDEGMEKNSIVNNYKILILSSPLNKAEGEKLPSARR